MWARAAAKQKAAAAARSLKLHARSCVRPTQGSQNKALGLEV